LFDRPKLDPEAEKSGNAGFAVPNVWPKDDIPQLESAVKDCSKIMANTGILLAHHIDKYV